MNNEENDPQKLRILLESRAGELFKLCDVEDKGFINKKDIQRMRDPLGLTPELAEEIFDSLDTDKNGYLTLDEFTAGFSKYLGAQWDSEADENGNYISNSTSSSSTGYGSGMMAEEDLENETSFRDTMDSLGATNFFEG